ncbi:MAG: hypothetical protein ACX939_02255 [Hyphococcus sp.]
MHSVSLPRPAAERPPELRVSIAIGAALIVQTGLALIWAGAASERLAQLERRADRTGELIERTARLEEQARFMSDTLIRIEMKLDDTNGEGA